jgi:hypothetical protein
MKENIFFTDTHEIGQTQKPIKPMQKMGKGAKVDEIKDIKDIASALRQYVKKKYPKYKFSVNIERFAGGQALRVNWYQADFNPLVSEEAWGDTKEGKRITINENYIESNEKLTPKAKSVLQDVVDFYEQYNYDFSEPQSDYYNVRFYTSVYVGTWGKPFEQVSGKPEKPKSTTTLIDGFFEIMNEDISFKSWDELTNKIAEINSKIKDKNLHWRLPTMKELETYFFPNKSKIPNLNSQYLSSEIVKIEGTNNGVQYYNLNINFKGQVWLSMSTIYNARLVRNNSRPSKPTSGTEQGIEPPMFSDGQSVIYKTSQGDKEGTIEYSKYVKSQNKYIYGIRTSTNTLLTIWESNIRALNTPQETPPSETPNELPFKVGDVFRENKDGAIVTTFTITSIDDYKKTEYRVNNLKTGKTSFLSRKTDFVSQMVSDKFWIPYDPLDENPQQEPETPQPETPSETKNEAIEELDDELILLNDLRKKTGILQDPDAQKEFREEISSLIDTREIFTEAEKFNVENLISTYFDNAIMNFNLPITSEQLMVDDNEIREITKSKDFKDWFGDWENTKYPSSKAIKINTETFQATPMVVYHGTKNPTHYSRFKTDKFPLIYFATNKKYAEWFAQLGNGIIYECFLNVRFPINFMDLGLKDITWQELSEFVKEKYGLELPKFPNLTERRKVWAWIRFDAETNFSLINAIKEAEFDAIIHIENNPQQVDDKGNEEITKAYMIFDPKNVKLVKFAKQTKGFSEIMFLKEGGRLSLMEEIKNLKK